VINKLLKFAEHISIYSVLKYFVFNRPTFSCCDLFCTSVCLQIRVVMVYALLG